MSKYKSVEAPELIETANEALKLLSNMTAKEAIEHVNDELQDEHNEQGPPAKRNKTEAAASIVDIAVAAGYRGSIPA